MVASYCRLIATRSGRRNTGSGCGRLASRFFLDLLAFTRSRQYDSAAEALRGVISEQSTRVEAHVGLMRMYALMGSKREALRSTGGSRRSSRGAGYRTLCFESCFEGGDHLGPLPTQRCTLSRFPASGATGRW